MSWLSDVWEAVAPIIPTAISAGTRLYGAEMARDANTDAARIATAGATDAARIAAAGATEAARVGAQGNTEAARIAAEAALRGAALSNEQIEKARAERTAASRRGIEAIRAGTADYAATVAPLLQERPILVPAYRGLTDAQQIARDDLRRNGLATVAASGMRGSGAGIRAVMDQDRRFLADAAAATDSRNLAARQAARGTADSARSALGQVYAQQGGSIANTELGVGNANATGLERIGQNIGSATTAGANAIADAGRTNAGLAAQAGQTSANLAAQAGQTGANLMAQAGLANANLTADTLGALGSIIADQSKQYAMRSGKYNTERSI